MEGHPPAPHTHCAPDDPADAPAPPKALRRFTIVSDHSVHRAVALVCRVVSQVSDLYFMVDIFLNFRTGYMDSETL